MLLMILTIMLGALLVASIAFNIKLYVASKAMTAPLQQSIEHMATEMFGGGGDLMSIMRNVLKDVDLSDLK